MAKKNAGKKGTKTPGKKRRKPAKIGAMGHMVAFLIGALTSGGGGTAVSAVVDEFTTIDTHPAVDGAVSLVTGATATGASATVKPLRKFVPGQLAGNVAGGVARAGWKWWRKSKAAEGTGNVRNTLRKRLAANGAGNVRETVRDASNNALAARFRN